MDEELKKLRTMKKNGFSKPKEVTWGDWTLQRLKHRHYLIAMMYVAGMRQIVIARELGYSKSRISILMSSRLMRDEIQRLRWGFLESIE